MALEITSILTVDEVEEWTRNSDLEALCSENPALVAKYIKKLSADIRTQIDIEQFKKGNNYEFPTVLKLATIRLLDSFYVYSVVNKQSVATVKKISYSEKIDDYSITEWYSDTSSSATWLWLPIDDESLITFLSFKKETGFWQVSIR